MSARGGISDPRDYRGHVTAAVNSTATLESNSL